MRTLVTLLAAALLSLGVILPATAADSRDQRIADVMEELQDVITDLSYNDNLSSSETDALRRKLAGLYRDLEDIQGGGVVAGYPDYGTDDNRANVWTRFGNATLKLNPSTARYSGWKTGNTIRVSYGDAGLIYLTVVNGPYTARWTLHDAYTGGVHTTVKAESSGNVILTVQDNAGTHDFLIKDGGLGPLYARNWSAGGTPSPTVPDGRTAGIWYKSYRDQVARRQLRETLPMTWLLQQYQDNSFVNANVRDFGVVLGELEGTPLTTNGIGTLRYQRNGRTVELSIPDPRLSPADFAGVAQVLYDLDQANAWYEFDLDN